MRRSVVVLTTLLLATAAAAGAGDDIKWSKSKKIEYVSPEEDPADLGDDRSRIGLRYTVSWHPYTHNNIYCTDVTYYSWELFAVGANVRRNLGQLVGKEYDEEVASEHKLHCKYLTFDIVIVVRNRSFFEKSGERYWEFYLLCEGEELEPINVRYSANPPDSWYIHPYDIQFIPASYLMFTHAFKSVFENPYRNAEEKKAERPPSIKLVMTGEAATRGFEWRFKE